MTPNSISSREQSMYEELPNSPEHNESTPLVASIKKCTAPSPNSAMIQCLSPSSFSCTSPVRPIPLRLCDVDPPTQQGSELQERKRRKVLFLSRSAIMALLIGTACGVLAYLYYSILEYLLDAIYSVWSDRLLNLICREGEFCAYLMGLCYGPAVTLILSVVMGLSIICLGNPGDLGSTVKDIHNRGYVSVSHVLPMVVASQCTILAGVSLGPEASLVAICAALGGFLSFQARGWLFRDSGVADHEMDLEANSSARNDQRNLLRKHTLMGMAGALSAFFGCPLGGSLFALEVTSCFGLEYYEHALECILCGVVCLGVFRSLASLPVASIWQIGASTTATAENADSPLHLPSVQTIYLVHGVVLGLIGAGIAAVFVRFHSYLVAPWFARVLENSKGRTTPDTSLIVRRAILGGMLVSVLGILCPYTLFWGEYEISAIANARPFSQLPHIWSQSGRSSFRWFEMDDALFPAQTWWRGMVVGTLKLMAISFTVAGGFRGGYIFPMFAAGSAFGRAWYAALQLAVAREWFPPVQLCVLCMAGSMNVALTRTPIATTLILSFLSGEQMALAPILAACITSLLLTAGTFDHPFIRTQIPRSDTKEAGLLSSLLCHFEASDGDNDSLNSH
jgi:H+/Cl- antiporter ClcA